MEEQRLPIDAEIMRQVEVFTEQLLAAVPELSGVAVIPVWDSKPEKFPPGLLRLRDTEQLYLKQLLQLQEHAIKFSHTVHTSMLEQLQRLDAAAMELAVKLRGLQAEAENTLAQADTEEEKKDTE